MALHPPHPLSRAQVSSCAGLSNGNTLCVFGFGKFALPTFFDLNKSFSKKAVIERNYFYGDMHFSEYGNQLIAADFLKVYNE
jgi:hypothetical protein